MNLGEESLLDIKVVSYQRCSESGNCLVLEVGVLAATQWSFYTREVNSLVVAQSTMLGTSTIPIWD